MSPALETDGSGYFVRLAKGGFLVYVVALPLVQLFSFRIGGLQVLFADLLFLGTTILWLPAIALGQAKFRWSRLYLFVGLFVAAMALSAVFSTNPRLSGIKLLGVCYLATVAVLTFNLCCEPGFVRKVLTAFVVGLVLTAVGVVAAVFGYYSDWEITRPLLSHIGSLPAGNYPRVRSFFENANMACNFLNVALTAALAMLGTGRLTYPIGIGIAAAGYLAALFTISPGLGGICLSVGVFVWGIGRIKRSTAANTVLVGSIALAIIFLVSTIVSPAWLLNSGSQNEPKYSVRVMVWMDAIKRAGEYPVLGRGTGTNAADLSYVTVSGQPQYLTDAHNAWLNILGQSGLVGLVAFTLLCWYLWSISRFRFDLLSKDNVLLLALSTGLLGSFFYQNIAGSFEDARHLWVWIGIIAAVHRQVSSSSASAAFPGSKSQLP